MKGDDIMAFEYEELDDEGKNRVHDRMVKVEPEVNYTEFLPAWEEEHYSHSVLCDELLASGEHGEDPCAHEEAMVTIESSVENVRAGKKPDGEEVVVEETVVVTEPALDSPK